MSSIARARLVYVPVQAPNIASPLMTRQVLGGPERSWEGRDVHVKFKILNFKLLSSFSPSSWNVIKSQLGVMVQDV